MADKATKDRVAADMRPPNFREAVHKIRSIKPKKDRISGVNGEIADIWAKIEGHKVNKKAGRLFLALDNLPPEERLDVMRSLDGLIDAAGWPDTEEDLVDQAESKVVHLRPGRARGGDEGEEVDENEAGEDRGIAAAAEDIETAGTGADVADRFLKSAKAHLGTGEDAAPPSKPRAKKPAAKTEPFTGDNTDLAGGGEGGGKPH